ncbi:hypothetical protein [Acetobacterium wieringae]|uniref:Clostridial hydrophobic W n=1 Tax=Acetobacterium wieringae TaxID=52694 RepID=A0A1F2PDT6_9FIRM|nr:hypothetical protein [Acetobacterium wieringae]OFV69042.1 clostridial hydrophobic W [Acetobacterium wieringae]
MRKMITGKLTSGLLCAFMVISVFFATGVFAATTEADTSADVTNTAAVEDIGVKYWGHVQNKGDMPWVNSPTPLGTRGESLRIEGFCFELTGDVPAGANLEYQVHVQNYGWMTPVEAGEFAGTRGESLRVESIRIKLVNLPGYDVYYQGHVQNVGNIPQVNGEWGWVKNGEELGTTGSSLRLEEIKVKIVKQPSTTTAYDKAGTYGPKTGTEELSGDAVINVPDVTLQNLHIKGTLTIGEGVGDGNVTLNNVTVDGDTFVRGGGENSIHINSGNYARIVVEKTASGNVRIVCTTASGIPIVVSEDAAGEELILEGLFSDVTINAPDFVVKTQGDTTIKNMTIGEDATGCEVTLAAGTTVGDLVLDSGADIKGTGTINKAEVNADGVKFETAPKEQVVDPGVDVPPVVPPVVPPGGGGGVDPSVAALAAVNAATSASAMETALENNASALGILTLLTKTYTDGGSYTYNTLTAGRQTALAADMLRNKPAGGYTLTILSDYFDKLANVRVVIEEQMRIANSYHNTTPTLDQISERISFMNTILTQLNSLDASHKALYLSNYQISSLIASLTYAQTQYNGLTDPERQSLLTSLFTNTYDSLGSLLTSFQTIYNALP